MSNKTLTICIVTFLVLSFMYGLMAYRFYNTQVTLLNETYELNEKATDLNHSIFEGKLHIAKLGYKFLDSDCLSIIEYNQCIAKVDSIVASIKKNIKFNDEDIKSVEKKFIFYQKYFKFFPKSHYSHSLSETEDLIVFAKEQYEEYLKFETDCHKLFEKYTMNWIKVYNDSLKAEDDVRRAKEKLNAMNVIAL